MIIETVFERKTFRVRAVRVTKDNIEEIAVWCGGELKPRGQGRKRPYVLITDLRGSNNHRAYPGDWITRVVSGGRFHVYRDNVFIEAFREVRKPPSLPTHDEIYDIVHEAAHKQWLSGYTWPEAEGQLPGIVDQIMEKMLEKVRGS